MDFFQHQEVARRNTGRLAVLFVLAVIGIIFLVHVSASLTFGVGWSLRTTGDHLLRGDAIRTHDLLFDWRMLAGISVATILIVTFGSLYKIAQLRGGGSAIAEMLGGRLVSPGSGDADLRRLLNVVEEMALASGTPVPPVYLMSNERAINAFAAGYSPNDAVIGVTRGAVQALGRDELQGVIAHEFSHILNGDMRLNIRLIGVLHGILVIGLIGAVTLRSLRYTRTRKGVLPLAVTGLALMVIGYFGTFFGRLIKAAVSRQREFLADASAVQFTRNPDGIAGALKKIGGVPRGSRLATPRAEEASHMFFGQAMRFDFMTLYATHPPLDERIRRIEPRWDGTFPEVALRAERPRNEAIVADLERGGAAAASAVVALGVDRVLDSIGSPTAAHLAYAARLLAAMPATLREASETSFGARAVVFAMLLGGDGSTRSSQWARLLDDADEQTVTATRKIEEVVKSLRDEFKLPLIDLCMPALRELSPGQYDVFRRVVLDLVQADDRVDPFEWMVRRSVVDHLDRHFGRRRPATVQYYAMARLGPMLSALLSSLAYAGHDEMIDARKAFEAAAGHVSDGAEVAMVPPADALGLTDLDDVIDTLITLAPPLKKRVLAACVACISADRRVTVREAEFVRAFADAMECPMPPILPGQRIGDHSPRSAAASR